jgi:hypothetical protein
MSLREAVNRNQLLTGAIIAAVLLLSIVLVIYRVTGSGAGVGKAYYTDDDGQSLFADSASRLPPFQRDGREAVRAVVLTCDGGHGRFIGWLEKYTPEAQAAYERQGADSSPSRAMMGPMASGVLVKKPGDSLWVSQQDPRYLRIVGIVCPDGSIPERVLP